MPARTSAGILLYRRRPVLEVLLAHPGGPFWQRRDHGVWQLPKGEPAEDEELLAAARREFHEETGFEAPGTAVPLGSLRQKGGKVVHAWAIEGDCDPAAMRSNTFRMEWPPRSGQMAEFPETDRIGWFTLDEAVQRILPSQAPFLRTLADLELT